MQGTGTDGRQWIMLVVVCGCLIALINFGVRASFGLFTGPISEANGWGRDVIALALAVQNLLWGAAQPVAGGLADRFGPMRVLTGGRHPLCDRRGADPVLDHAFDPAASRPACWSGSGWRVPPSSS